MASVSSEVDVKEEPLSPLLEYDQVGFEFFIAHMFITNTTAIEGVVSLSVSNLEKKVCYAGDKE